MSIMKDKSAGVNRRIAARVRALRVKRALALDALAKRSGVSRSMISLIERGESSPTAAILEKLAAGLGVVLASFFDDPTPPTAPAGPVTRCAAQPVWRDPASGYLRRNVTPLGASTAARIVEVRFPPRQRVAFEAGERNKPVHQHIWVLDGAIDVTVGSKRHQLRRGDCLTMELEGPTMFHNPGRRAARYAVVTTIDDSGRMP